MTDEQFCIDILPRVSRTFALSIETLPEPMRQTIRAAYLLCRIVDTIEDDGHLEPERRQALFETFSQLVRDDQTPEQALETALGDRELSEKDADGQLVQRSGAVFRVFRQLPQPLADAARPHILEMAEGMASYARRAEADGLTVLSDQEDLERYCYYVAGTVGNLLTAVFLQAHPEITGAQRQGLEARSVNFGLGLQLTNISRDIATDHERGWCFFPASWCARHGVAPVDLLQPDQADAAMSVVRDTVDLARQKMAEAVEYTLLLPATAPAVRLFVLVPLVLSLATLTLVHRSPAVLRRGHPVKVSRGQVANALGQAADAVGSDEAVRQLCEKAARLEL
jgi:farnesyl-diphosphate farnesyltransferase